MKKHVRCFLLFYCLISIALSAEIIEVTDIVDIVPYAQENSLVLFDIDDTLIDYSISLGTGPWRKYLRKKIEENKDRYAQHEYPVIDLVTYYILNRVPVKPVEESIPNLIHELQNQCIPAFAFTARGRTEWYTTQIENIDFLTKEQLMSIGIDFETTVIPFELQGLDPACFMDGIIFASHIEKGLLLEKLLIERAYHPSAIIFVDDKMKNVQSMEAAAESLGVPFIGFWYKRAELNNEDFDPVITTLQLRELVTNQNILSDEDAKALISQEEGLEPDRLFEELIDRIYSLVVTEFF